MDLTKESVRDVVISNPAAVSVFEEFHIDYCCNGHKNLADACSAAGVDPSSILLKIASLPMGQTAIKHRFAEYLNANELIDHIVSIHHTFTRDAIGRLDILLEDVLHHHGPNHPELREIAGSYNELKNELTVHMQKEEFVLFPYVKELHQHHESQRPLSFHWFGTIQTSVRQLMNEHDSAGSLLRNIRRVANDFQIPGDACLRFGALYTGLRDLESDLHRHIHLENNVLFPLTVSMEQALLEGSADRVRSAKIL